jgi:hypothetical protein
MNIKVISSRLSFANHRQPYVSAPDPKTGEIKRSWNVNGICEDTPFRYKGKEYTTTQVEYETGGKKFLIPHTEFMAQVIPLVWAEKGVPVPKVPYLNYAYNRADQTIGMRAPKIDSKTGDYFAGYAEDTYYFYGKTDADKNPVQPIIVDQAGEVLDASSGHPVSGDYTVMLLSVYVFGTAPKMGVSASYNGMQYLRKGEPFGAAVTTADAFEKLEVEVEEGEDPNF